MEFGEEKTYILTNYKKIIERAKKEKN